MHSRATHSPRLVAGALAAAWLVLGTRWSSYLGVPPIFITDVLLAAAFLQYTLSRPAYPEPSTRPRTTLLGLLFAWAALRFVTSPQYDLLAVRDAVPYLYAAVGMLSAVAVSRAGEATRRKTGRLLVWALAFHAAWYSLATFIPGLSERMPLVSSAQSLHVFSVRADVDTAFAGVFAGWLLTVVLRRDRTFWPMVAFLVTWGAIIQTDSRAGLAAALVATGLGFIAGHKSGRSRDHRKALTVAAVPILLCAVAWGLPQTDIGERVAGTFGVATTEQSAGAAGTTGARLNAWEIIWDYTFDDPARAVVGVGFGPDFLLDSGAGTALIGAADTGETVPRSPHNYWVGTLARLGLVGLLLVTLLAVVAIGAAWRQVRRPDHDDLAVLAALIPVSLIPVALLGVVLESPFGAAPYFWAIGVLLTDDRRAQTPYISDHVVEPRPNVAA